MILKGILNITPLIDVWLSYHEEYPVLGEQTMLAVAIIYYNFGSHLKTNISLISIKFKSLFNIKIHHFYFILFNTNLKFYFLFKFIIDNVNFQYH